MLKTTKQLLYYGILVMHKDIQKTIIALGSATNTVMGMDPR